MICVVVQVLMIEGAGIGGGSGENKGFKTRSLSQSQWFWCVWLGAGSMVVYVITATIGNLMKPIILGDDEEAPIEDDTKSVSNREVPSASGSKRTASDDGTPTSKKQKLA